MKNRVWRFWLGAPGLLFLLIAGCSSPPEPVALSTESLLGSWTANLEHNGQTDVFALAFELVEGETIGAFAAIPTIGAWRVPVGAATLDVESGTVTIGRWVLTWDPLGPALTATMPESMVPVHAIEARFEPSDPVEPAAPPADPTNVEPVWTYEAGSPIWGGVAHADGLAYVGDDAGTLHAVDVTSGERRWSVAMGGAIRARPTVDGSSLYVPSDDGYLYRVNARDGSVEWKMQIVEGEFKRGDRFDNFAGSATIEGDTVYVGSGDGRVLALNVADGTPRWTFEAGDAVASTPAVADGRVFVGSFDGKVYALDAASGESLWQHDTGAAVSSSAVVADGRVLIGSRSYDLFAFDAASGEVVWRYYYWFSWVDSDPNVVDGVAYIGSSDAQRVLAIDVASGKVRWTGWTGGWSWPEPAVDDHAVYGGAVGVEQYIGERRGVFMAFRRDDGEPLWQFAAEPVVGGGNWGFASAPAVAAGHVLVGGLDGKLYAFPAAG